MNNNQIIYKGDSIIIVPLSNSNQKVTLLESDYKELERLGAGLPWKLVQGQIVVRNNNKNLNVARLILDAGAGMKVWFVDGNTLNLCTTNLIKTSGNGKHRTRDQLEDPDYSNFKKKWNHGDYVVVTQ